MEAAAAAPLLLTKRSERLTDMTPLLQLLTITLVSLGGIMMMLWLISLARRDASIVDPFWGAGFVMIAWIAWGQSSRSDSRSLLLITLTTIWGLRLSGFLLWRNWSHGEDRRYAAMRAWHGPRFAWVSLFTVFLLQAVILWLISFPIQAAVITGQPALLSAFDLVAVLLWTIGFVFETAGDWQLARFKANPANTGQVMNRGLWRYTRHPNYFGDFCIWWGLFLLAIPTGAGWTIFSPLLMSVLLMKISGVTLLESTIVDRRPDYAAYQSGTSSFFPWFPRSK